MQLAFVSPTTANFLKQIFGVDDYNLLQLVPNRIYTSLYGIIFTSGIVNGDWIDCKWNITTVKNTTDYKCDIIVQNKWKVISNQFTFKIFQFAATLWPQQPMEPFNP
jgi:hypothetical protein